MSWRTHVVPDGVPVNDKPLGGVTPVADDGAAPAR
jgi:hypothetical protein